MLCLATLQGQPLFCRRFFGGESHLNGSCTIASTHCSAQNRLGSAVPSRSGKPLERYAVDRKKVLELASTCCCIVEDRMNPRDVHVLVNILKPCLANRKDRTLWNPEMCDKYCQGFPLVVLATGCWRPGYLLRHCTKCRCIFSTYAECCFVFASYTTHSVLFCNYCVLLCKCSVLFCHIL